MVDHHCSIERVDIQSLEAQVGSFLDDIAITLNDWDTATEKRLHVTTMDADVLQLELHFGYTYILPAKGRARTLRLFGIYVGQDFQRRGFCSRIITLLEEYAERQLAYLLVGPLFSEELAQLLGKRQNYRNVPPFSCLYDNPKYAITEK